MTTVKNGTVKSMIEAFAVHMKKSLNDTLTAQKVALIRIKTYPLKFADPTLYIQRKITEALANISEV